MLGTGLLGVSLGAAFSCCFSFAFSFHAGLLVTLSALDFRQNSSFLDFFLEALEGCFDTFALCYSDL